MANSSRSVSESMSTNKTCSTNLAVCDSTAGKGLSYSKADSTTSMGFSYSNVVQVNNEPSSSNAHSVPDQPSKSINTLSDGTNYNHRHNMHCTSVVCATELYKFIPESHLDMLTKWVLHVQNVWALCKY